MKWITRRNIHVDRTSCPWLIRKFIDPHAEFFFVDATTDPAAVDGHTFDMRGAEYGHEGDKCTFQVMLERHALSGDAALVEMGPYFEILTTDLLVEDVHFRRATTSARDLGAKALTVNVSDVAAMGGSPRFALVSLALPADVELSWVVELYGGLRDAAAEYATSIVGGDSSLGCR